MKYSTHATEKFKNDRIRLKFVIERIASAIKNFAWNICIDKILTLQTTTFFVLFEKLDRTLLFSKCSEYCDRNVSRGTCERSKTIKLHLILWEKNKKNPALSNRIIK